MIGIHIAGGKPILSYSSCRYLASPVGVDVDALRAENERLKAEVSALQHQLAMSQSALAQAQGR